MQDVFDDFALVNHPNHSRGVPALGANQRIACSPDGNRIAVGFPLKSRSPWGYSTTLQDPLGERPPLTLAPCVSAVSVQPMLFTPDGEFVAVLTTDRRVAVFDAGTGERRRSLAVRGG